MRHDYENAASRREAPIESAERYATRASVSGSRLYRLISEQVEVLFGHSVAEAIRPAVEDLTESSAEAMHHFREAVDELRNEAIRHNSMAYEARNDLGKALDVLRDAIEDTDRRFKRRGATPPEWVTRARSLARNPLSESTEIEPF